MLLKADIAGYSSSQAIVDMILSSPPFAGLATVNRIECSEIISAKVCVCIPMQNEAELLPDTLASVGRAIAHVSGEVTVILVANNTTDKSVALAASWASETSVQHVIVDAVFADCINNAPHARRLALDIGAAVAPEGSLLTTDADTLVDTDWITRNLQCLEQGSDLVCGTVSVDEKAIAELPPQVHECGELEREYFAVLRELWRRAIGDPAAKLPFVPNAMGASLAIKTAKYIEIGRLPTPKVAEDKALARLVLTTGGTVTEAIDVKVITSCRTQARAKGGMGDALYERATEQNPLCDEALVPVETLLLRASCWKQIADSAERNIKLAELVESRSRLRAPRMRMGDVMTELAIGRELLIKLSTEPARRDTT